VSKKVSIAPRAGGRKVDEWVSAPAKATARAQTDEMKRLTIDIPAALHRKVKAACATEGVKMADVVRELLTKKYGNP
jgi:hypothetical protein